MRFKLILACTAALMSCLPIAAWAGDGVIEINQGDSYQDGNAIRIEGNFARVRPTSQLWFAVVDDSVRETFVQTNASLQDASTVAVELSSEDASIPSDTYRFSILEVTETGERHTRARGFLAVSGV